LSVDNRACRPLAPGVPPVRALCEALTQCTTQASTPLHIEQIAPAKQGALVVDQPTQTATVTARATSQPTAVALATWEVDLYPASPAGAPPAGTPPAGTPPVGAPTQFDATHPPGQGFQINVTTTPPGPSPFTSVNLVFTPVAGSTTLVLPSGVYLWRLGPGTL